MIPEMILHCSLNILLCLHHSALYQDTWMWNVTQSLRAAHGIFDLLAVLFPSHGLLLQ
uniref:Uncharacterized protein n=1 Tax=Arundo donax TaxID=35708 RepID=A0A0A9SWZ7_ARUDO